MAKAGLSLLGASAFRSQLTGVGGAIGDAGASNMDAATAQLHADIQARAPVDTGELRDSYQRDVSRQGRNRVVGRVWSDAPHAAHQEFGTVYQPGTPHVRPAIEANRASILDTVGRQTLADAIHTQF